MLQIIVCEIDENCIDVTREKHTVKKTSYILHSRTLCPSVKQNILASSNSGNVEQIHNNVVMYKTRTHNDVVSH